MKKQKKYVDMIQIENKIYCLCETGDWLLCGIIKNGIDCNFIEWIK